MPNTDFYNTLRERLHQTTSWPSVYMFKFILSNDNQKMALLRKIFEQDSRFFEKTSSRGNFISVTVKLVMLDPDEVIAYYRKVAEIEGVMML
ncbi:MAG TPA: DUF493 domain-containing protein [Bacteroidales bacterium]|nr:DUF493 domain-containing protein [Bacteroidales bacterium]